MALKVVGSGLGRTGTMSLKLALEQLGFTKCHHMVEVFMNPSTVPMWVAAAEGKPDWDGIFEGYQAMVDYPGASFWKEIAAHYPDAKVLHSQRDPDDWFESTQATIFSPTGVLANRPPEMVKFFEAVTRGIGDHLHDRDFMIDMFNRHNAEVVATIPKDRLLVYQAGQGWEPLCAFLGVAVPDTPYPKVNSREEFGARAAGGPPTPDSIRQAVEQDAAGHAKA